MQKRGGDQQQNRTTEEKLKQKSWGRLMKEEEGESRDAGGLYSPEVSVCAQSHS